MILVDSTPLSTSVRRTFLAANRLSTGFFKSVYAIFYIGVSRKTSTASATYYPVYSVYTYNCRREGKGNNSLYRRERSQVWTPRAERCPA